MHWILQLCYDFCAAVGFIGMAALFAVGLFDSGSATVPGWLIIIPAALYAALIGEFYRWPKERAARGKTQ